MTNIKKGVFQHKLSRKEKDAIAKVLQCDSKALDAFEKSYREAAIDSDSFFSADKRKTETETKLVESSELVDRIVNEFLNEMEEPNNRKLLPSEDRITRELFQSIPIEIRPQCTADLMTLDIEQPSYQIIFSLISMFQNEKNEAKRKHLYGMIRTGMECLDLDPVIYRMLEKNPNNMSYWLPALQEATSKTGFFLIPSTKIIKVPLTMLQLSRLEYTALTPTTLKIVDDFCMKAFDLDVNKSYFVKTGIFSSKYDFRNAKVVGEKEVRELGEYLLYITNQACQMASPLTMPTIYGAATTNEWVVREYIEDKEDNPCIYHGLPLHTEYRVFVDCDSDEILGISPYWRPDVMKKRFSSGSDANTPDMVHDYIIYSAHEETLMNRYNENKDRIISEVKKILPYLYLKGQWSLDIMQNGDDFYAIDMALASESALKDVVPDAKIAREELSLDRYLLTDTEIQKLFLDEKI